MKTKISFCPLCASTLDAADDDQFECEECEKRFFIQIVEAGEEDDEDEEEDDEDDDDLRDDDEKDEDEDIDDEEDEDEY